MLLALAAAAILMAALGGAVSGSLRTWSVVRERHDLVRQARFAMDQMVSALHATPRLLLPLPENPATPYAESIRDVLAVALDPTLDRDGDGFADADNDEDGRLDEDSGNNLTKDGVAGIQGIDDDGDGAVDEGGGADDDEDGVNNEDPINGIDDDGDGAVDEDPGGDLNGDGSPGVVGIDDDGDGSTDEGNTNDDDEDGQTSEDWVDVRVFFLNGSNLMERTPNVDPADGSDFTESTIAVGVTQFRVERVARGPTARTVLVDLSLELTGPSGEKVSLGSRVRIRGGP